MIETIDVQICNAVANCRRPVRFAAFQKSYFACFAVCAVSTLQHYYSYHTVINIMRSGIWPYLMNEASAEDILDSFRKPVTERTRLLNRFYSTLLVNQLLTGRENDMDVCKCGKYLLLGTTLILNYALAPVVWIIWSGIFVFWNWASSIALLLLCLN